MSSHWLRIIENAFGGTMSVGMAESISLGQFRTLLGELMTFHNAATLPSRTSAQLRPRLDGDGSWRALGGLKTSAPQPLRSMIKSLLLLADSVALQDPLVEAWLVASDDAERLMLLRRRLRDVVRIADLIRTDVVVIYSPPVALVSANSGYSIGDPDKFGQVPLLSEADLTLEQQHAFRKQGLQFDWDAAWLAHALEHGSQTSFANSLALVTAGASQHRLFFSGNTALAEQVKGLLWEQRVRRYYNGLCDPGPMAPETSGLFCAMLRLLRQAITSRDEVNTTDYFFLLSNPLVHADRLKLDDVIALRHDSAEFASWRDLIRQSLDYAYHAEYRYLNQHAEFVQLMQSKIDSVSSALASGRRGQFLSHSIDVGEAFTVGGAIGLAQYFLQANLQQSLIAAPVAAVGAILWRVVKTLCLEKTNSIQAHYVAFRP